VIAKISRGSDAAGLARYLHGPGRANEHAYRNEREVLVLGGKMIAGTVPGADKTTGRTWAKDFHRARQLRPKVQKNVWHCSLRADPNDRRLSDAEWTQIGITVAARMGFAEHPWVLIRHGGDHVHLAASRVSHTGAVWKGSNDCFAVRPIMREVERRFELRQVPDMARAPTPQTNLSQGEHRRAQRTQAVPGRAELAMAVRAARDVAAGQGRSGFEAELDRAGVAWRANVAPSTGRMNGYSFDTGSVDGAGAPVTFTASQLDRTLSWTKLAAVLEGPVKFPLPAPLPVEAKKRFERAATYAQRVTATQEQMAAAVAAAHESYRAVRGGELVDERATHRQFWAQRPVIDPDPAEVPALTSQQAVLRSEVLRGFPHRTQLYEDVLGLAQRARPKEQVDGLHNQGVRRRAAETTPRPLPPRTRRAAEAARATPTQDRGRGLGR